MHEQIRRNLLEWFARVRRDLPWRRTRDPYAIWVSEVMLQQTRVSVVVPYYEHFMERFPDAVSLAVAEERDLLAAWAGLGYYSRVRNMQRAARLMGGIFPSTYESIRELPGVGEYTAAAVASIAFGLPHAAVDGNVLRVAARLTNDRGDIQSPLVRKRLGAFVCSLLDRDYPGTFNEAVMELGATVCVPASPLCDQCPVSDNCEARRTGTQNGLPVKGKRVEPVLYSKTLLIVVRRGRILLWRRADSSKRLAGFWELPEPEHFETAFESDAVGTFRHSITNGRYTFEVRAVRAEVSVTCKKLANCRYLPMKTLENVALSTTARKALRIFQLHRQA